MSSNNRDPAAADTVDSSTHGPIAEDLRCSVQTAALGEHPAGSAGTAHRFLLIDLPYPWPKKIDEHPLLLGLADSPTDGASTRILGINDATGVADPHRDDVAPAHRVILYSRPVSNQF